MIRKKDLDAQISALERRVSKLSDWINKLHNMINENEMAIESISKYKMNKIHTVFDGGTFIGTINLIDMSYELNPELANSTDLSHAVDIMEKEISKLKGG